MRIGENPNNTAESRISRSPIASDLPAYPSPFQNGIVDASRRHGVSYYEKSGDPSPQCVGEAVVGAAAAGHDDGFCLKCGALTREGMHSDDAVGMDLDGSMQRHKANALSEEPLQDDWLQRIIKRFSNRIRRRKDRDDVTSGGEEIGRRRAGHVGVLDNHVNVPGWSDVAIEDIGDCKQPGPWGDPGVRHARESACGKNRDLSPKSKDVVRAGFNAQPNVDAKLPQLPFQPVDDSSKLPTSWSLGGRQHLSAKLCAAFDKDHVMAAYGRNPRGLQSCRTPSDHYDTPSRWGEVEVRKFGFPADQRVVDALDGKALVQPADTPLVGANARPDVFDSALRSLPWHLGIGDDSPGHTDEVRSALGQRGLRLFGVDDPTGVEDGCAQPGFESAGQWKIDAVREVGRRDVPGASLEGLDGPAGYREQIDDVERLEETGHRDPLRQRQLVWEEIIAAEPHDEQPSATDRLADGDE